MERSHILNVDFMRELEWVFLTLLLLITAEYISQIISFIKMSFII